MKFVTILNSIHEINLNFSKIVKHFDKNQNCKNIIKFKFNFKSTRRQMLGVQIHGIGIVISFGFSEGAKPLTRIENP